MSSKGSRSQVNESGPYPGSISGLKGFGRRLNLKEMLILHKLTREETRNQLGISFMPPGTKPSKAPSSSGAPSLTAVVAPSIETVAKVPAN